MSGNSRVGKHREFETAFGESREKGEGAQRRRGRHVREHFANGPLGTQRGCRPFGVGSALKFSGQRRALIVNRGPDCIGHRTLQLMAPLCQFTSSFASGVRRIDDFRWRSRRPVRSWRQKVCSEVSKISRATDPPDPGRTPSFSRDSPWARWPTKHQWWWDLLSNQ